MNSFDISINTWPDENTGMAAYLESLFAAPSQNYDLLKYEIQREFRFSGSPDISRMAFDRITFDPNTGKGSFRVILDINFTFGCEDITTSKSNQTSDWTFEMDKNASVIHFYGSPYIDSRSTADEF